MECIVIVSRTVAPSLGSSVMNDVFIYIQGDFFEPSRLSKHSISSVSTGRKTVTECLICICYYKIAHCLKQLNCMM